MRLRFPRPRRLSLLLAVALTAALPSVAPSGAAGGTTAPGYWLLGADGRVMPFGTATTPTGTGAAFRPAVAMVPNPAGAGWWVAGADGSVAAAGDAPFLGSMGDKALNRPIAGMAATPTGAGYWLVGTDGGIFSFGDAAFHGSTGAIKLNQPIVGMTASPSGKGYWFVASDGGIFAFGDAGFFGSTGNLKLNRPIVGMTTTPSGHGYWLVASDGGIFAFGDAPFYGSTGAIKLNRPIVGMAASPSGKGYWFVASDGGIFSYGDAAFAGSAGDRALASPIVGMAAVPAARVTPVTGAGPAPTETTGTTGPTATTAPAAPDRAPFEIGVIGDTGYTTTSNDLLEFAIADMNTRDLAFVVHDGDIMGALPDCEEKRYTRALDMMNRIQHPVVYTPGDNEWVDCTERDARLAKVRGMFFATDQTLGGRTMTVIRQAAPYVENQRWERGGVTFGTVHLVNTHDNSQADPAEHQARRAANLEWLRETFAQAKAHNSAGMMLSTQANIFPSSCPKGASPQICFDEGTWDYRVYADFLDELYRLTVDFAKPVVLSHGDTHIGRVDHPIGSPANFTRVENFAQANTEYWMHIKVDASTPAVFDIAVRKAPKDAQ